MQIGGGLVGTGVVSAAFGDRPVAITALSGAVTAIGAGAGAVRTGLDKTDRETPEQGRDEEGRGV
jgi:hypothetical protein